MLLLGAPYSPSRLFPLSVSPTAISTLKSSKPSIKIAANSKNKSSLNVGFRRISMQAHDRNWEDPHYEDNESSSEDEGDDEWGVSYDSGREEEEEVESTVSATSTKNEPNYYEELVKEVEMLLEPEEIAILEQNEAPVLDKISTDKWSPLQTLALSGQIPFMDKLLGQGIHIDDVDKDGFTALHKAVIGKKEAVISHLLRAGANAHVRDRDGATALHYAVQVGAMQTVKLLIKYRVDVNVADNEGWTPLHVAMQIRCRDIAKVLLVNGADKTRRTKGAWRWDNINLSFTTKVLGNGSETQRLSDGKTPLDLSLCYGRDFKSYGLAKLLKLVPAKQGSLSYNLS